MKNVKSGHKHPIVCLNAGHAGKVNRSPVVPEYYESEMNWKLHNYLADELEKYGIEVRKTRKKQTDGMALMDRGKAAKGCDLWLSIHSNAFSDESVDRPVVIHLVPDNRTKIDEQSKELAKMLGQTIYEVMGTNGKPQITYKRADKDFDGDGALNDEWYGELRGAHNVGVAGMILEHSFHTNKRAAKWLLVDANLKKLAKAEAKTIAEYFGMTGEVKEEAPKAESKPQSDEKIYRIRKSWNDAESQVGAYRSLENAKNACPEGYSVFDEDGKAVYTKKAKETTVDYAASFLKSKAGVYKVTASNLNMRSGASTLKKVVEVLPKNTKVECYGYYTNKWLYVVSPSGKKGFCNSAYLKKV